MPYIEYDSYIVHHIAMNCYTRELLLDILEILDTMNKV